jgi:hypothetical protein
MPRKRPGPGRPRSKDWLETSAASDALGLTAEQLLRLRVQILKPVKHWHCKNPTAAPMGRRYLFNIRQIQPLLMPEPDPAPSAKQAAQPAKLDQGPHLGQGDRDRLKAPIPRNLRQRGVRSRRADVIVDFDALDGLMQKLNEPT